MRRFLYKYFSGDYLHVVSLIASHYRVQRIRAGLCYARGCREHGVVWLDQAGIFCWDHYAEQMQIQMRMPRSPSVSSKEL